MVNILFYKPIVLSIYLLNSLYEFYFCYDGKIFETKCKWNCSDKIILFFHYYSSTKLIEKTDE